MRYLVISDIHGNLEAFRAVLAHAARKRRDAVLFLGDAATHTPWGGFGRARHGYSDDVRVAAAHLDSLWTRLPADAVRYVCTAHAHCAVFSDDFLRDVRR